MERIWVSVYYVVASLVFLFILNGWQDFLTNRKKTLLVGIGELLIFLLGFFQNIGIFFVLMINMLLAVGCTKGKIAERIVNSILAMFGIAIMEDWIRIIFSLVLHEKNDNLFQVIEIFFIGFFVILLKKLFKKKKQVHYFEGLTLGRKFLCLVGFVDILSISVIGRYLLQNPPGKGLIYSLMFAIMFLFGVTVCLIISMIDNAYQQGVLMKENEIKEYVISEQKSVYHLLLEKNQETRRFRHDIKNHLVILKLLLEKDKEEEATQYLEKITDEYDKISVRQNYFDDEVVDSILTMLCQRAKERNIEVIVEGNLIQKKMNVYDLCCILTNAIGNAMEACEKQGVSGPIHVVAQGDEQMQLFLISNPASEDMYQNILKGNSTKEDTENHGFGIRNMRSAVVRMHGEMDYLWDKGEIKLQISMELM